MSDHANPQNGNGYDEPHYYSFVPNELLFLFEPRDGSAITSAKVDGWLQAFEDTLVNSVPAILEYINELSDSERQIVLRQVIPGLVGGISAFQEIETLVNKLDTPRPKQIRPILAKDIQVLDDNSRKLVSERALLIARLLSEQQRLQVAQDLTSFLKSESILQNGSFLEAGTDNLIFTSADGRQFAIARRKLSGEIEDTILFELTILLRSYIQQKIAQVPITAITPNWLSTGSPNDPDSGSGGGPGTKPVKPDDIDEQLKKEELLSADAPWDFTFPDTFPDKQALDLSKRKEKNNDVTVIILDTAPPALDSQVGGRTKCHKEEGPKVRSLEKAYKEWVTDANDPHQLLKSLLSPGKPHETKDRPSGSIHTVKYDNLTIWYAEEYDPKHPHPIRPDDPFDIRCVCKAWHDTRGQTYRHRAMDHGTFIAGIIHTLCPTAHIHLVQVLNDYAYGSLFMLAKQLNSILEYLKKEEEQRRKDAKAKERDAEQIPIIVNMSLVFDIPLEKGHQSAPLPAGASATEKRKKAFRERIELKLVRDQSLAFYMATMVRLITELFVHTTSDPGRNPKPQFDGIGRIVAAAGNDGHIRKSLPAPNEIERPPARFPAAFPNVIGISSLGNGGLAPYSNNADRPRQWGIAAVGGDEDKEELGWSHADGGILGLYIGEFPDKSAPNNYKKCIENDSGWARWSGTSFATPVVAGVLAQLLAVNSKTPTDVDTAMDEAVKTIVDTFTSSPLVPDRRAVLPTKQIAQP